MAKVKGLRKVLAEMTKQPELIDDAMAAALYEEASAIMQKSVREVPVDTGRLRQSHYIELPENMGQGLTVRLGYGTDYALAVHERQDVSHTTGKSKYLQDPVNNARKGYLPRLGRRAWKNYRQGVRRIKPTAPTEPKE